MVRGEDIDMFDIPSYKEEDDEWSVGQAEKQQKDLDRRANGCKAG